MVILHIFLTLFLGLLPGLLRMWIVFGTKFKGMLLWIFSWLIGWAYIAFGLYIIQFVHYGIGRIERFFLLLIPIIIISILLFTKKTSFLILKDTLFLKISVGEIKKSYKKLSPMLRIVFWLLLVYIVWYIILTFTHNISFPSYHMDSLLHRNMPAVKIMINKGTDLYKDYGTSHYPLFISIYKSLVFINSGGVLIEKFSNIFQRLMFFILGLFTFTITWQKTKNILYSILPISFICGLPLVYFLSVDGYADLSIIIYVIVSIWSFYNYLQINKKFQNNSDFMLFGLLFLCILSFIKNDGAFVYIPIILCSFFIILLVKKKLLFTIKDFFGSFKNIFVFLISILFFVLPYVFFTYTKSFGNDNFWQPYSIITEKNFHLEIIGYLPNRFLEMNNYNSILILIIIFTILFIVKKLYKTNLLFLFLTPLLLFFHILFTVFVFSANYMRFLNQTASNRIFTMVFVLFLSFTGFYLGETKKLGKKI